MFRPNIFRANLKANPFNVGAQNVMMPETAGLNRQRWRTSVFYLLWFHTHPQFKLQGNWIGLGGRALEVEKGMRGEGRTLHLP
jgi:hypothetical protein